jgi:hypothetical protein
LFLRQTGQAQENVVANEQKGINPNDRSKRQPPPATVDEDMSEQDQREMGQSQSQTQRSDRDQDRDANPNSVEIGDPVPEDDRTTKARDTGATGEDEDLPDDDAHFETPSERH